jgi:hypothetical protein
MRLEEFRNMPTEKRETLRYRFAEAYLAMAQHARNLCAGEDEVAQRLLNLALTELAAVKKG